MRQRPRSNTRNEARHPSEEALNSAPSPRIFKQLSIASRLRCGEPTPEAPPTSPTPRQCATTTSSNLGSPRNSPPTDTSVTCGQCETWTKRNFKQPGAYRSRNLSSNGVVRMRAVRRPADGCWDSSETINRSNVLAGNSEFKEGWSRGDRCPPFCLPLVSGGRLVKDQGRDPFASMRALPGAPPPITRLKNLAPSKLSSSVSAQASELNAPFLPPPNSETTSTTSCVSSAGSASSLNRRPPTIPPAITSTQRSVSESTPAPDQ